MQCRQQLEEYLQGQNVQYQVHQHPLAYTAQQIAENEHISGKKVAKSVVVFADQNMVLLVLPADRRVDFDALQAILGTPNVRLAKEEEFQRAFPNCAGGSMPPFGNLYGIPVYVEQSLAQQHTIVFPIGTHTLAMSIQYADLDYLVHPTVATFAHKPLQA
jgi:Ala-tRNA(Pro) deacylase